MRLQDERESDSLVFLFFRVRNPLENVFFPSCFNCFVITVRLVDVSPYFDIPRKRKKYSLPRISPIKIPI